MSITWNLGILFSFKYFNFFTDNFITLFNLQHNAFAVRSFNIILPVGLSFYTFQTISYTIDVYKNKLQPTKKLLEFLCFVSFFPQLVAGPIERASFLLPQFFKNRQFKYCDAKEGLRQILWGLFKKMVVADNLALAVNAFFDDPIEYQSMELTYGLILFYFQIYCDFSGYADIALGSAKLFGFKLHMNFKLPHFATSIPDFWRRWNITLSQWFRDYVHIPFLQNRKKSILNRRLALIVTFGLIGLWHGAAWTFIIFGFIHAVYMIGYQFYEKNLSNKNSKKFTRGILRLRYFSSIILSFSFLIISIVFFRAQNTSTALIILQRIFSLIPDGNFESIIGLKILFLPLLIFMEIYTREKDYPFFQLEERIPKWTRWIIYYLFIYFIIQFGGPQESFIYFQF
ncbi:MBOAT family O-acyltransferase [Gramella sp. AN32]|uniref:MBOAT family O-acyltransferase n=1 Tax=Christiangramia antarctica TaxID=2058158 RepID=A0ABW5X5Y4_9FLAO|nr:MBOAT family O-acyltransferase [Gramella sp. AN32]